MAWFNPKRVTYSPNAGVIAQAGGQDLRNVIQSDFNNQIRNRDLQLMQDKFGYQQEHDNQLADQWNKKFDTSNQHWDKTYQNTLDNQDRNYAYKDANLVLKADANKAAQDYRNRVLGNQEKAFNANQQYKTTQQKQARDQNVAMGKYLASIDPKLAQMFGYNSEQPTSVFNNPQDLGYLQKIIPKPLTPYQQQTLDTRKDLVSATEKRNELKTKQHETEVKTKTLDTRTRNADKIISTVPNFDKLDEAQQFEAKQYYIETGKLPRIVKTKDGGWFGSDEYTIEKDSPNKDAIFKEIMNQIDGL